MRNDDGLPRRTALRTMGGAGIAGIAMGGVLAVPDASASADGGRHVRAVRVAHAFYRALQAKDIDAFAALWTPDAVYRVPVTVEGGPGQLTGRDEIVAGIREFFALFADVRFTWEVEPMLDPRRVMATWTLDIGLVAGGRYRNRGVAVLHTRGDRIADFSEHFDTAAFLDAFAGGRRTP